MKSILEFAAILVGLTLLVTCSIFPSRYEAIEFLIKGDDFTLAWDAPQYSGSYAGSEVVSYRVYYRVPGQSSWSELKEIEAEPSPSLQITSEDLSFGHYEFAVSAVNGNDAESSLHSSTDKSADPATGWYINWIGSR